MRLGRPRFHGPIELVSAPVAESICVMVLRSSRLATFIRGLVLPKSVPGSTLATVWEKLITIGSRVVARAKSVTFRLGEVAVPRPP
jgi:hypothetical protein